MSTITINSFTLQGWNDTRTGLELWVFANQSWLDSAGGEHGAGSTISDTFVKRVTGLTADLSARTLTFPSFTLIGTTDALKGQNVRMYFWIVSVTATSHTAIKQVPTTENGLQIPPSISSLSGCSPFGACCTIGELVVWNQRREPTPIEPQNYYNTSEIDSRLLALADLIGTVSNPVLTGLPVANLPTGAGRLQRALDGLRGLYMGNGFEAVSITGRANIKDFGAKVDGRVSEVGNMASGSSILNCSDGNFTIADIGKNIDVNSSGSQTALSANIESVTNGTTAVVSTAASFTLSGQTLVIRGTTYADCATTAGSKVITSATAAFVSSDIARPVTVTNAGRFNKAGTILSISSPTSIVLSFSASGTVVNKRIVFGTDDSAAINLAIASPNLASETGRKVIYFPSGKCCVGTFAESVIVGGNAAFGALKLSAAGITLEGDGMDASQIYSIGPVGNDTASFAAVLLIADGSSHATVRDLGFIGTNALAQSPITGTGICDGIFMGSAGIADGIRLIRCRFDYCWFIGAHVINDGDSLGGFTNLTVDSCEANYNAFDGFNPSGARGLTFTNNRMSYNGTGGLETGGGNALIAGNKVRYGRGSGFSIGGFGDPTVALGNIVSDNSAEFVAGIGFVFGSNIQDNVVVGNEARCNDLGGMVFQNGFGTLGSRYTVRGNAIISNGTTSTSSAVGVLLSAVFDVDFSGNTVLDGGIAGYSQTKGITLVGGCNNIQLVRNNVKGHSAFDYTFGDTTNLVFKNSFPSAIVNINTATFIVETPTFGHIVSAGPLPALSARPGLGAGSVSAINCKDMAGTISVTAGAGSGGGDFVRLTFGTAYGATPHVMVFAGNANAASLALRVYNLNLTGAFFDLADSGPGLTNGQTYIWHYQVIQ